MTGNIVSAVFDTETEAERAVAELRTVGVTDNALSVIAQHGNRTTETSGSGEVTHDSGGSFLRGLLGGGALGAGLGIAALAIPGVGPLAAAGAIAASAVPGAAAAGAAVGAISSGISELLNKHGVSDADAGYYDERIRGGGTFVSVDIGLGGVTADTASDILYRNGGHNASRGRTASTY